MEKKRIEILDCTIRDGGYVNNWWFEKLMARDSYRSLSKGGVDYVELGFGGNEEFFDPKKYGLWRFSKEKDLRVVTNGIEVAKGSIMGDFGKLDLEDRCDRENTRVFGDGLKLVIGG